MSKKIVTQEALERVTRDIVARYTAMKAKTPHQALLPDPFTGHERAAIVAADAVPESQRTRADWATLGWTMGPPTGGEK